jgi:hypothetical protein
MGLYINRIDQSPLESLYDYQHVVESLIQNTCETDG